MANTTNANIKFDPQLNDGYEDCVLDITKNTARKYTEVENADGTVSFTDATSYENEGSIFDAQGINAITGNLNKIVAGETNGLVFSSGLSTGHQCNIPGHTNEAPILVIASAYASDSGASAIVNVEGYVTGGFKYRVNNLATSQKYLKICFVAFYV